MQIPPEIIPLYRSETSGAAASDNRKTEPVGESTALGSALSESAGEQNALRDQENSGLTTGKRESRTKPGKRHTGDERRKDDRRKASLPVTIDTRIPRSHRRSSRNAGINVTA